MLFRWSLPPFEKGGIGGIFLMLPYDHLLKNKARSLRTNPTDAVPRLWHYLRRKQILGVQFYRQKPIGNAIKIPPNLPLQKGGTVYGRVNY